MAPPNAERAAPGVSGNGPQGNIGNQPRLNIEHQIPGQADAQELASRLAYSRRKIGDWTELLERAVALRDRIANHSPADSLAALVEIERDCAELRLLLRYAAFKERRAKR